MVSVQKASLVLGSSTPDVRVCGRVNELWDRMGTQLAIPSQASVKGEKKSKATVDGRGPGAVRPTRQSRVPLPPVPVSPPPTPLLIPRFVFPLVAYFSLISHLVNPRELD